MTPNRRAAADAVPYIEAMACGDVLRSMSLTARKKAIRLYEKRFQG